MLQSQIKNHFIRCKVDGCQHKFTSVNGIVFHLRHKHGSQLKKIGQFIFHEKFNYSRLPWKWINTLFLKKFVLLRKTGWKCWECGFNKRRKDGGIVLELDHLDGNHHNNEKSNLRILCPNCHAMTLNFRNWGNKKLNSKSYKRYDRDIDNIKSLQKKQRSIKIHLNITKRKLTQLVWNFGYIKTGILFKVSPTTVRRWCKKYKIKGPDGICSLKFKQKQYYEIFGKELEIISYDSGH